MQPSTQPPVPPTQNNALATEIGLIILSIAMLTSMTILLIDGTIDWPKALAFLGFLAAIWTAYGAYKAPSPAQQQQNNSLFTQFMDIIPGLVARLQQPQAPPQITIHNNIPSTVPQPVPAQIVTMPQMAPAPRPVPAPQYPDIPTISTASVSAPSPTAWQTQQPPQSVSQFAAPQYPPRFPEQARVGP